MGIFFSNLDSANAKKFWKAVKQLNNKNTTIPTLSDGQSSVSSNTGKVDVLNKYFFSCFNCKCPPLTSMTNYSLDPDIYEFPEELLCSEDMIADILANLNLLVLMTFQLEC